MAVFQAGFEAGALGFQAGQGLAHRRDPGVGLARNGGSRLGQLSPVSAIAGEVREEKKKRRKKLGEEARVRGEGEEEEEKKKRKKPGEEACVRGEGKEEKKKRKKPGEEEEACVMLGLGEIKEEKWVW
jgi:hypothetical protein